LEETRQYLEVLTIALIDAGLTQKRWSLVMPMCLELIRTAQQDAQREERLRWFLIAGQQAVQEGKGHEITLMLKEIESYLPAYKELAVAFDDLKRKITTVSGAGK
jgi:hypothetical protein